MSYYLVKKRDRKGAILGVTRGKDAEFVAKKLASGRVFSLSTKKYGKATIIIWHREIEKDPQKKQLEEATPKNTILNGLQGGGVNDTYTVGKLQINIKLEEMGEIFYVEPITEI